MPPGPNAAHMPSQYRNAFRTSLSQDQIAQRLGTLPGFEWTPVPQDPGSFRIRGKVRNRMAVEIWHEPGPNLPNRFALLFSIESLEPPSAANAYFETREKIHEILEARLVIHSVEEEIRATLDAGRDGLNLDSQDLPELPAEIRLLGKQITWLGLGSNRLTTLPEEIAELTELTELDLSNNLLEELPSSIGALQKLDTLYISENRLRTLPVAIGELTGLRKLILNANRLEQLPPEIGSLQKLRELNIEENRLTQLPAEFLHLSALKDFDLEKWRSDPRKKHLPPTNIRALIAGSNPWVHPPAETVRQGVKAIREYLTANPTPSHPVPAANPTHLYNPGPGGITFDSTLRVPESMEPRMESRLKEEIPELKWEDLAENWDKIRIQGTTRDAFERVSVSISRNESPGPFKLRIRVNTVLETEAKAFHKAMMHRLWLSLFASGSTTVTNNLRDTPHPPPFVAPFFSLESSLDVPEALVPSMALRTQAAVPELAWTDISPDWEQVRILGKRRDATKVTLVSIHREESTGSFHIWIHTAARSWVEAQGSLQAMLERVRLAILSD